MADDQHRGAVTTGDDRVAREVSAPLLEEAQRPPAWMYEWQLAPDLLTPVIGPALASVHGTRAEMIEREVRDALAAAGPGARALDLACSAGYFSHRLLEWGAAEVVAIDIRDINIRRAELVATTSGSAHSVCGSAKLTFSASMRATSGRSTWCWCSG